MAFLSRVFKNLQWYGMTKSLDRKVGGFFFVYAGLRAQWYDKRAPFRAGETAWKGALVALHNEYVMNQFHR